MVARRRESARPRDTPVRVMEDRRTSAPEPQDPDRGPPEPRRVVLADADPLARRTLRSCLEGEPNLEVIADAASVAEAIELAESLHPDVLLCELKLPDGSGIDAAPEICERSPETAVVLLSAEAPEAVELRALRAGAVGFLHKSIDLGVLPRVLRGVLAGEGAITRSLTRVLIEQVRALEWSASVRLRPVTSPLTEREWEVLDLLAQGAGTAEIAERLDVRIGTVRTHIKHVLGKLGLHSRKDAIRYLEGPGTGER